MSPYGVLRRHIHKYVVIDLERDLEGTPRTEDYMYCMALDILLVSDLNGLSDR
jgi:hypothetical protein